MNNIRISENFSLQEFACRHCNTVKLDSDLLRRLQLMRDELGSPIFINSAYRCPVHNRAVGGTSASQHLQGKAADITTWNLPRLRQLAEKHVSNGGIGTAETYVHVDTRGFRARWNY